MLVNVSVPGEVYPSNVMRMVFAVLADTPEKTSKKANHAGSQNREVEMSQFIIRNKEIRQRAAAAVSQITGDKLQVVTIKDYVKNKSSAQLGYLWSAVIPAIRQHVEDATGDRYTDQDIYDYYIDELAPHRVVTIGGKPKIVHISASQMTVEDMQQFLTDIINVAAEDYDCVIPYPQVAIEDYE